MEPPNAQGGDKRHALTPGGGDAVFAGMAALGLPDTPTPSFWKPLENQGSMQGETDKEGSQQTLGEDAGPATGIPNPQMMAQAAAASPQLPSTPPVARELFKGIKRRRCALAGEVVVAAEMLQVGKKQDKEIATLRDQVGEIINMLKAKI